MKNSKLLSCVLTAMFTAGALSACNTEFHDCQHVCEICGNCYDATCEDKDCSKKCQGHTLSAPTLTLNNNVVTWNKVEHANSYDVYVNNTVKSTVTETTYTIADTAVGTYQVAVAAKGNGAQISSSEKSAAVTYVISPTKLTAPVIALNGNVVSWTAVANAGSYAIYVNDAKKTEVNTTSYTISETTVGTYSIKVAALAGNAQFEDSEKSNELSYVVQPTKLATPSVTLVSNVASWTNVTNATSYDVYVNNVKKMNVTTTSYTITETELGSYNVQVVAVASSNQYVNSDKSEAKTYTISVTELAAPVISLNSNVVSWNAIANATNYEVFVNNVSKGTQTATTYTIVESLVGDYEIKVMAKAGSNLYSDSLKSNAVSYTVVPGQLGTPTLSLSSNVVSWNAIANAANYEVFVNDTSKGTQTETSFTITDTLVGDYEVKVVAKSNSGQYTDSAKSAGVTYTISPTKLNAPVASLSGTTVSWAAIDHVSGYDVYLNDAKVDTITATSYEIEIGKFGTYKVEIVAVAESTQYSNSDKSNSVSYNAELANYPVLITTRNNTGRIKYDTELGALGWAAATENDADIAFKFIPESGKENTYRILTQDGLYLQEALFLDNGNAESCHTVGTFYSEAETTQLWTPRLSTDGTYYTIINVGRNDVLNAYAGYDHIASWSDVPSYDLQFTLTPIDEEVTFAESQTWSKASDVNFNKPFIMYFAGRNALLDYNASEQLELSATLVNGVTDYTQYAFEVEDAGDGYFFIKDFNGEYLKAIEGNLFTHAAKENTDAFKFMFNARGGHYFTIINKAVGPYPLCKSAGNEISVYGEFPAHGDQWFRIYNVDSTRLSAPTISLNENIVSWNAVENAASYDVYVNNTLAGNQAGTSYTITNTEVGNYEVYVVAKGASAEHTDSFKSNKVTFAVESAGKLSSPVLSISNKHVTWEAVTNAASYDVYVNNAKVGNQTALEYDIVVSQFIEYAVQVVAVASSGSSENSDKSNSVSFTATLANSPVVITTRNNTGRVKYDNEIGALGWAAATENDADIAFKFIPEPGKENTYRILTQDGLYLQEALFLDSGNAESCHTVGTFYSEAETTQLWTPRLSTDGTYYTIINVGRNDVLNAYAEYDHIASWSDVPSYDLQFTLTPIDEEVTFAESQTWSKASDVNFNKPFIMYFAGRNALLDYNASEQLELSATLVNGVTDYTQYAFEVEDAGDGYFFIKDFNGEYLKAIEGNLFTHAAKENTDAFKFMFNARGGHYFTIINKAVGPYPLCKSAGNEISVYGEFPAHGDQWFRIYNVDVTE